MHAVCPLALWKGRSQTETPSVLVFLCTAPLPITDPKGQGFLSLSCRCMDSVVNYHPRPCPPHTHTNTPHTRIGTQSFSQPLQLFDSHLLSQVWIATIYPFVKAVLLHVTSLTRTHLFSDTLSVSPLCSSHQLRERERDCTAERRGNLHDSFQVVERQRSTTAEAAKMAHNR